MKHAFIIGLSCLMLLSFSGCTEEQQVMTSGLTTTSSVQQITSSKKTAQKYLDDVKKELQKTKKDDYFKTKEWTSFVDGFWKGYNDSQKTNKEPDLMTSSEITY